MTIQVTIEHHGRIVAKVETARPDVAAQLTYDAAECAINEECSCGEEADAQYAEEQAIEDFLNDLFSDVEECDCPPGTCLEDERLADEFFGDDPTADQADPNNYQNGANGLSVAESANRASSQVADILNREVSITSDEFDTILETANRAIEVGIARNTLYRFAGEIAREYREGAGQGLYKDISLADVFKIKVDKAILSPEYS